MANPIAVFICYKKLLVTKRNKTTFKQENSRAEILQGILRRSGAYEPWRDVAQLPAGVDWETEIYNRIFTSDVLLVLVAPGTSESEWVRREIALANALGVSIFPLGTGSNGEELERELKGLGIAHLQARITTNIKDEGAEALLAELRADLSRAVERTRKQQAEKLEVLLQRQSTPVPKAPDNQKAETFTLERIGSKINIHIASGDIAHVRGIDVLVNSENDFMQMARFFEKKTLSSILRRRGSSSRGGKYQDTIQRELDWVLRDFGRPFQPGEAFATSAGGPYSELARVNRARYIIHVTSVQAVPNLNTVVPFGQPDQIESCMRGCLSRFCDINKAKGVISPPDTLQIELQQQVAGEGQWAVRSIIFPLFGAGKGGSAPREVLGPMMDGFEGFFDDPDGKDLANYLTDVYISAFTETEVAEVSTFLQKRLGPRVVPR